MNNTEVPEDVMPEWKPAWDRMVKEVEAAVHSQRFRVAGEEGGPDDSDV